MFNLAVFFFFFLFACLGYKETRGKPMVSIGNQDYLFTPSQVGCNRLTVSGFLLMVWWLWG